MPFHTVEVGQVSGPIGVAEHLAPYLPGSPLVDIDNGKAISSISAAPFGSAGVLPISYGYVAMMGPDGLLNATKMAILNANYIKTRLEAKFPILYTGSNGRCAHEMIVDCRAFKSFGIEVEDIAKRLMDYGFHAPTVSFPVAGTLMIEPTESETKEELDRFCDALLQIREEIEAVENGTMDANDNVLKNAPLRQMRYCLRCIFCVGRNYAAHAREMGKDPDREPPFFFTKPADAVVDHGTTVPYPPETENLHYEAELVVAIGKGGHNIAEAEALAHIWGYAAGNDLTRRDLQQAAKEMGRPWDWGKAFDRSAVIGPVHPVESTGHLAEGPIRLTVNGTVRQDGDLSELIWSVPEVIAILSRSMALQPGDLIMTGTPRVWARCSRATFVPCRSGACRI